MIFLGWILVIIGILFAISALSGGGIIELPSATLFCGLGLAILLLFNSGEDWLYKKYSTPGTAVKIPEKFAEKFQIPVEHCHFTTTYGPTGVVIRNDPILPTWSPFIVYVLMECKVPKGDLWINDLWIQQWNEYQVFTIAPDSLVLEGFRFDGKTWMYPQSVMMETGPLLGEQTTKNAYYFSVVDVLFVYE